MRPRFGLKPTNPKNEILDSAVRHRWQQQEWDDWKKRHTLRDKQKFVRDQEWSNDVKDDEIGGVMELGILNQVDGQIDKTLNGSIIIGGKEHQLDEGTLRIVNKKVVDTSLNEIVEKRRFKDSIISAITSDRSGAICRMILPSKRYKMLIANEPTFLTLFRNGGRPTQDIVSADGRPEMFMLYHESSPEFARALHKLSLVVDKTTLSFSEGIDDWLARYNRLSS